MSAVMRADRDVPRRRFLVVGAVMVAGAGPFGSWIAPTSAAGATAWPTGRLRARDAMRVKERAFMPAEQFRQWDEALDQIGPANQRDSGPRAARSTKAPSMTCDTISTVRA